MGGTLRADGDSLAQGTARRPSGPRSAPPPARRLRAGASVRVGEEGAAIVRALFKTYHAHVRDGKAFSTLSRRISPLRLWTYWLVRRGAKKGVETLQGPP